MCVCCPEQSPAVGTAEHSEMQSKRAEYMTFTLVGAFLWLANVSRPELAYPAGQLARYVANPGVAHYRAVLRVLVYLRGTVDQKFDVSPVQDTPLRAYVTGELSFLCPGVSFHTLVVQSIGCPACRKDAAVSFHVFHRS